MNASTFTVQTVTISNPIEDTPEGMACMDRIRAQAKANRERLEDLLTPDALASLDEANRMWERELFFGSGASDA